MGEMKPDNPKKALGDKKIPLDLIPPRVMKEVALAMKEGADKYGRYNYRTVNVLYSTYYASTMRHLSDWFEGEDIDPDSGLSHVTKAIAGLLVLRDAMEGGNITDDRPTNTRLCGEKGV